MVEVTVQMLHGIKVKKYKELYRKDAYNNEIYKPSYGKDTKMGWNVDHIKP